MATGQTLFHRFFYRKSFKRFDAFQVAMGSLFLAAKIEEKPKRLREVLNVFYHLYRKRKQMPPKPLELGGDRYQEWKMEIIKTERHILKELGFRLYGIMEHPHKFILYYIKCLDGTPEMSQKAWSYLNDSLRTDCCVRFRSQAIACAAIFMAARELQVKLPDNPPWWTLFETSKEEICEICKKILQLYQDSKIMWLEPLSSSTKFADKPRGHS
jgi:transcription initiation factor TFIIIB Brf1 subunit/transcription initiation factor TFIIB